MDTLQQEIQTSLTEFSFSPTVYFNWVPWLTSGILEGSLNPVLNCQHDIPTPQLLSLRSQCVCPEKLEVGLWFSGCSEGLAESRPRAQSVPGVIATITWRETASTCM